MKRIKFFMEQYDMITRGDRLVAGVSGGADSVCLFFVLLELREEMDFDFTVVHVNHGLRGEAADADEMFVRRLCDRYGVKSEVFRVDLESIAKKRKQSLEEAGRMVRREAFETTRRKYGCNKIALAHHQNDNAETLLWNLSRGAGLRGLGGIRPVNGIFIRPLLCLNRREIEQYLSERKQEYCTDATNEETEYTRNKLRHLVIPVLEEQVNTQAVRHMNEAMEQIREVQEYMTFQADMAYKNCVQTPLSYENNVEKDVVRKDTVQKDAAEHPQGNGKGEQRGILILGQTFLEQPAVLQKMIILRVLEEISGQMKDIGQVHVEAALRLFAGQVGRKLDLPYQILAERVYEGVRFYKKNTVFADKEKLNQNRDARKDGKGRVQTGKSQESIQIPLLIPGETVVSEKNLTIRCKILPKGEDFSVNDIPEKVYTKWFDYDIIKGSLCIRTRESGDRIVIDREGHSQKLKSWFVNNKIPAEKRETQMLIADGQEIVWIPGYRMSSAYQIRKQTKQILQIEIYNS